MKKLIFLTTLTFSINAFAIFDTPTYYQVNGSCKEEVLYGYKVISTSCSYKNAISGHVVRITLADTPDWRMPYAIDVDVANKAWKKSY